MEPAAGVEWEEGAGRAALRITDAAPLAVAEGAAADEPADGVEPAVGVVPAVEVDPVTGVEPAIGAEPVVGADPAAEVERVVADELTAGAGFAEDPEVPGLGEPGYSTVAVAEGAEVELVLSLEFWDKEAGFVRLGLGAAAFVRGGLPEGSPWRA